MDRRLGRLLMCAATAVAVTAAAGGCSRRRSVEPAPEPDNLIAPEPAPLPPSPSPRTMPAPAPATRPATAPAPPMAPPNVPATAPSPATRPTDDAEEVRSVRGQFAETFEHLDLFRREVAELRLDAGERREAKGLFDRAAGAWAQARSELDAGRLPEPEARAALARLARDTESKVKTLLGPERSIQLAAYRQTPRGGGQRFVARLRIALESLHGDRAALTAEQSPRVDSIIEQVRTSVQRLPAQDAETFEADQAARQRIRAVIDQTRARLAGVLTPAQMAHVTRQVPSLAKPGGREGPTTRPG